MRSERRVRAEHPMLPFDLAPDAPRPAERAAPRSARASSTPEVDEDRMRCRLRNDAFASRGWPAGTELLVDVRRRPQRGEVALVREGGRLKIGVLERQLGRSALRTDHGTVWLGSTARFVGVVTLVGATLDGMPDLPPASSA